MSSFCRPFRIADEQIACDRDPRFKFDLIHGTVPLVYVDGAETLAPAFRELMGIEGADRILLVGGGVASGVACIDMSGEIGARTVQTVGSSIRDAVAGGYTPVISYAVPEQRGVFDRVLGAFEHDVTTAATSFHLDVDGADFYEWVQSLSRSARRTWQRDIRQSEELGVTYRVESLTDSNLRQIAALISVNERLNGMPGNVRLTEWRLRSELSTAGEMSALCGYDGDGELVSTVVARTVETYQELRYVGIGETAMNRRDLYHDIAFLVPVRAAFETNLTRIEYGRGHALPKKVRGCQPVSLSRYALRKVDGPV